MLKSHVLEEMHLLDIEKVVTFLSGKEAIFFDMDGTILNSECLHFEAIKSLTSENNPYTIEDIFGMSDFDVYPLIAPFTKLSLENFLKEKNQMLIKIIPQTDVSLIIKPEMITLLKEIKQILGKKLCVVTASEESVTHCLLKHCGIFQIFDHVVTRQSTTETKPNPMPYLHALALTNTTARNALVFEDSPTGIKSATSAGIEIIKVTWYEK